MIAEGKLRWVTEPLLLGIVLIIASLALQDYIIYVVANIFLGVAIALMIIFRDPPRKIGRGVVSPADGSVLHVNTTTRSFTLRSGLFDVHIIRAPISGKLLEIEPAQVASPSKGSGMRQTRIVITTKYGPITLIIQPRFWLSHVTLYIPQGKKVKKGERIAAAFSGAYVSMHLPDYIRLKIGEREKLIAGNSTIAVLARPQPSIEHPRNHFSQILHSSSGE